MRLRHPEFETDDPRLDYIPQVDARNSDFPLTAVLGDTAQKIGSKRWRPGLTLDQGVDGACVGAALTHVVAAKPSGYAPILTQHFPDPMTGFARNHVYWSAQRIDPWPGGEYPRASPQMAGTSLLAGLKVMRASHWFDSYHWAGSADETARAIVNIGPVLLGTVWHAQMIEPDSDGYIRPQGVRVGGHCVAVTGFNEPTNRFTILNSWGKQWGRNGTAYLSADDLDLLLQQGAEIAVPTNRTILT